MDKARIKILSLYTLLGLTALSGGVPDYMAQNFCLTMILVLLIAAYLMRSRMAEDSLEHHHYTFIIRSIWIYSLLAAIGMCGAAWNILQKADQSAIDALLEQAYGGSVPGEAELQAASQKYMDDNMGLILQSVILWMSPALLYLLWRVARGSVRAYRNYRVQNIYSWL